MTHTALGGLHLASICLWAWPMPYALHHEKCHEPGLPTAAEGQELGRGAAQHQALQDTPFSLLCLFLTTNGLRGQLRGSALTPKQALRSWDGLKPALRRILLTRHVALWQPQQKVQEPDPQTLSFSLQQLPCPGVSFQLPLPSRRPETITYLLEIFSGFTGKHLPVGSWPAFLDVALPETCSHTCKSPVMDQGLLHSPLHFKQNRS